MKKHILALSMILLFSKSTYVDSSFVIPVNQVKPSIVLERIVESCDCPVPNPLDNISDNFNLDRRLGRYHKGIDIRGYFGEPIKAIDDGIIEYAGKIKGYGNTVIIKHDNYYTLYAHGKRRSIEVKTNEIVKKGETLMLMGSTGNAIGVHLHFEVLDYDKKPFNPILTLKTKRFIY